ncbi:MAG TPA: hypothetical protein VL201_02225 [Patescibacteria group bacterium]|jgi:hypothetical protein|nr:hypothetical protein [Patescibacteria group bacterium]
MAFYSKQLMVLLIFCFSTELFSATANPVKRLPEYDEFVLKNKLLQDINTLLEEKSDVERKQIMEYLYGEINANTFYHTTAYTDKNTVDRIKEKIQYLSCLSPREAEELQQLTSACLKSISGRGIKYTLDTLLKCFASAEGRLLFGKGA